MRNILFSTVASAALALSATAALAVDPYDDAPASSGGWYVSLFGGGSIPEDISGEFFDAYSADFYDFNIDLDNGFLVGGAVGAYFNSWLRGEFEVSYAKWNAQNVYDGYYDATYGADGGIDALYVLTNLWFDLDMGSFTPYAGGGIGGANVDIDIDSGSIYNPDNSEWAFAYQAGGGLKYELTDAIDFDLAYRYRGIMDFNGDDLGAPGFLQFADGLDLNSHNVTLGMIFNLNSF
jgi:opacity protein-like surface antigen